MNDWSNFARSASDVGEFLVWTWPVTGALVLTFMATVAGRLAVGRRPLHTLRTLTALALPSVTIPVGLIAVGIAYNYYRNGQYSNPHGDHQAIGWLLFYGLFFGQLPIAGLATWLSGRDWPAVLSAWALAGWCSLPAAHAAAMSISNQWL